MSADPVAAAVSPGVLTFGLAVAGVLALVAVAHLLSRAMGPSARRRTGLAGRYLLLVVLSIVVLFPLYITVVNSLLRPDQIVSRPPTLFPTHPDWSA